MRRWVGRATESFTRTALVLALVGALHGLLYVPLVHSHEDGDAPAYLASAHALLHGSYTTPIGASTFATPGGFVDWTWLPISDELRQAPERQAFRPPGYPLLLAAVGGAGGGVSRALLWPAQALLLGLSILLLAFTVRRWWGPQLGLLAALFYAVDPYSKRYVALVRTETLTGFIVIAAAYAFTRAWQERSWRWWAAAGLLVGAATLVRPAFVIGVPLLVIAALLRQGPWRGRVVMGGASVLAAAVLLVPWVVHVRLVTGKVALANAPAGFNLLVAAHGQGRARSASAVEQDPGFVRDVDAVHRLAPPVATMARDREAHPRYMARADGSLSSKAWSVYRRRIEDDPAAVAWEFLYRAYDLWMARDVWYQPTGIKLLPQRLLDDGLLLLAALGIGIALVRGGAARGVGVFLLVYTLVLAVQLMEARFGIPVRGLYLAFAALGLVSLARRLSRAPSPAG